jgi:protein TonB
MRSSRLLVGTIIVSGGLHVAAAAAIMMRAAFPETGTLQTPSNAISVETQQSTVLESVVSTPLDAAAAASAAMPQGSSQATEATLDPLKPVTPKEVDTSPPPPAIKAAELAPDVVEAVEDPLQVIEGAGEPDAAIGARPQREEREEPEERKMPGREEAKRAPARRQTLGGPTSRASASGEKSGGRASASTGSVLTYAARVRAKVASNRPSVRGRGGTAQVSFGVSPSGALSYVRLSRSSGNPAFDSAALSAVRRAAPFGPPPPGTSAAQLRFSIPFYFR